MKTKRVRTMKTTNYITKLRIVMLASMILANCFPMTANAVSLGSPSSAIEYFRGKVGIGQNNINPSVELDVKGDTKLTGNLTVKTGTPVAGSVLVSKDDNGLVEWKTLGLANLPNTVVSSSPLGTANRIAKYINGHVIGDSPMFDLAGNIGIGTTRPTTKLDVAGTIKGTTGQFNDFYSTGKTFRDGLYSAQKIFELSFPNPAVPNQKVDLYLNGTQAFWGTIDVTIEDGYSWQNASGGLTKRFYLGITPSGVIYTNKSRYIDEGGVTADNYAISDLRWDTVKLRYYVTIVHRTATANAPKVLVKATAGHPTAGIDNFLTMVNGPTYTTDSTVYPRPYISFINNVGFGTNNPLKKLDVNGGEAWFHTINPTTATAKAPANLYLGQWSGVNDASNPLYEFRTLDQAAPAPGVSAPNYLELHAAREKGDFRFTRSGAAGEGDRKMFTVQGEKNLNAGGSYANFYDGANVAQAQISAALGINSYFMTGNVGIGLTSPTEKLEVAGNVKARSFIGNGSGLTNIRFGAVNNMINNDVAQSMYIGPSNGLTGPALRYQTDATTGNTGVGYKALTLAGPLTLVTAVSNTALGYMSLGGGGGAIKNGSRNTAIGNRSAMLLMNGDENTAIGYLALGNMRTNSSNNIAIGPYAVNGFNDKSSSSYNIGIGTSALYSVKNNSNNLAIGSSALYSTTNGNANVALGYRAGNNIKLGSNNIVIGPNALVSSVNGDNQLSIGNSIYGTGIGTSAAKIGIGVNTPTEKLEVAGNVKATSFIGSAAGLTNIQAANITGSVAQANLSLASGNLNYEDNRMVKPNELAKNKLKFGFTSWINDNGDAAKVTREFADFLHLRSYSDNSGGNDNLIMFNKKFIAARVWQQAYDSGSAYSNYEDILFTGHGGTAKYIPKYSDDNSVMNSSIFDNGGNIGIGTIKPLKKLDVNGGEGWFHTINPTTATAKAPANLYLGQWSGVNDASTPLYEFRTLDQALLTGQSSATNYLELHATREKGDFRFTRTVGTANHLMFTVEGEKNLKGGASFANLYDGAGLAQVQISSATGTDSYFAVSNLGIGTKTPGQSINKSFSVTPRNSTVSYDPFKPESAGKLLDIYSSNNEAVLNLISARGNLDGSHIAGVYFSRAGAQEDAHKQIAAIQARQSGVVGDYDGDGSIFDVTGNLAGGDLYFFTKPNGSGIGQDSPRMVINAAGNVGIGTKTPQANLEVVGTVKADSIKLPASLANCNVLGTDANGYITCKQSATAVTRVAQ